MILPTIGGAMQVSTAVPALRDLLDDPNAEIVDPTVYSTRSEAIEREPIPRSEITSRECVVSPWSRCGDHVSIVELRRSSLHRERTCPIVHRR